MATNRDGLALQSLLEQNCARGPVRGWRLVGHQPPVVIAIFGPPVARRRRLASALVRHLVQFRDADYRGDANGESLNEPREGLPQTGGWLVTRCVQHVLGCEVPVPHVPVERVPE